MKLSPLVNKPSFIPTSEMSITALLIAGVFASVVHADISPECALAAYAMGQAMSDTTDCPAGIDFGTILGQQSYNTSCTVECATARHNAFQATQSACMSVDDIATSAPSIAIVAQYDLTCLNVNNTFCYPTFFSAASVLEQVNDIVNEPISETPDLSNFTSVICTPCMHAAITALSPYNDQVTSFLNTLSSAARGNITLHCDAIHAQANVTASNDTSPNTTTTVNAATVNGNSAFLSAILGVLVIGLVYGLFV